MPAIRSSGSAQKGKEVNTVPVVVLVCPAVQYISNTGQYQCTVSGLSLLFYIYLYIYIYIDILIIYLELFINLYNNP